MCFAITGEAPYNPQPESDLGDAPDSSNSIAGSPAMTAYPATGTQAFYPTVYVAGSPPHGPLHRWPVAVAHLGPVVTFEIEADIGPEMTRPTISFQQPLSPVHRTWIWLMMAC